MKKIIIPLMAIAAFATACQVEDLNEANQGQQNGELFTIEAAITPSTKTSLTVGPDSYKVDWDADDALSVVAKYSDGSYSGNEFTKGEGNTFSGTVTNPGDITELNVFYPYNSHYTTIDSEGYGNSYITFGSSAKGVQSQTGINNTDHIDAPLYGYTTVTGGTATVTMSHASTLFEVIVTNSSDIDIKITNITLTNSEDKDMVGTFFINPKDGSLKSSGDTYTSPTASLNINNGTLTTGQTGKFYITSAPFELAVNSSITVTVTANGQETEIIKTVSKATSFVAGTVNHLNVTIKEAQEIQPIEEGQYLIAAYNNGAWAVMTPENGGGYFLPIVTEVSVPIEEVAYSDFYSVSGINNYDWTIEATEDGYSIRNSQGYIAISDDNVDYSQTSTSISILKNADGTYNIAGIGATNYLKYNTTSGQERFKPYSSNKFPVVVLIPWVDDPDYKYCDVTPEIINVSADAGETSFNISSNTTWTISSSNPAYELSQSEGEGNAEITITYPANTTEDNINVIFTISSTVEPKTVTLNQQSASVIPIDVLTADELGLGSSYANFSDKSFTSLAQYAGNAMKSNMVGAIQIRSSKNNSGIVSTHSGGIAKEVSIECSSEQSSSRTLDIYGSNTPYSSASDLYDSATQGTKLGSIQCTENGNGTLTISGEYKYIGIRSSSSAIYLSSITITWGE